MSVQPVGGVFGPDGGFGVAPGDPDDPGAEGIAAEGIADGDASPGAWTGWPGARPVPGAPLTLRVPVFVR
jgi:hypothetical protein